MFIGRFTIISLKYKKINVRQFSWYIVLFFLNNSVNVYCVSSANKESIINTTNNITRLLLLWYLYTPTLTILIISQLLQYYTVEWWTIMIFVRHNFRIYDLIAIKLPCTCHFENTKKLKSTVLILKIRLHFKSFLTCENLPLDIYILDGSLPV